MAQIIADHTIVDRFDNIPQAYIDEVKKLWLLLPGESHAAGYRTGLEALEALYPAYQVNVGTSPPEAYTDTHLRISSRPWGDIDNETGWALSYGEEDWFTSALAKTRTKAGITYCNDTFGVTIGAMGFGWCWDLTASATDYNTATDEYVAYCAANSYATKIFYTTGPVDTYTGEQGYWQYLKYTTIRDHVALDNTRVLFDYADILCYDDDGSGPNTTTWDGHTYPIITSANEDPVVSGHISAIGRLRIAKAMWWMLARLSGWEEGAIDSCGNNDLPTSGVVTNPSGKIGTAFTFDSTDYVGELSARVPTLELTTAISISAWFKTNVSDSAYHTIVSNYHAGYGYYLSLNSSYQLEFFVGNGITNETKTTATTYNDNAWHHVIATFDGTNLNLYVAGVTVGGVPATWNNNIAYNADCRFFIGARALNGSTTLHWNGVIDEIGVWDRALDTEDITELYNGGAGLTHPFY